MPEISSSKYLVQASWGDVPHIDLKTQKELLDSSEPHLREPRSTGAPGLSAGAIWPVAENEIVVDPFPIPAFWPRAYALDVGWNRTAVLWGALDRGTDTWYFYTEHYRGKAEPSVHSAAIRGRGEWIHGVIDPAARGRAPKDGEQLLALYKENGLKLTAAKNAVEAGLHAVYERLTTGRIKVFKTLMNWRAEYRLYRRDEDGAVVKEFDHLMDCTRYLIMSGRGVATVKPPDKFAQFARSTAGSGDPSIGF